MDRFENSSEDTRRNGNTNSAPRIFRDLERCPTNYVRKGFNSEIKNKTGSSWDDIASPEGGFLDDYGSIGDAISNLIAASKRRTQKVIPQESDNTEIVNSLYERILKSLSSYTVRRRLCEKAAVRWHEIIAQFNEVSKDMDDLAGWERFMSKTFSRNVNVRILEQSNDPKVCFEYCFPMLSIIWQALKKNGQKKLEIKSVAPKAQVLENGSVIIADFECCFIGEWTGGSRLERKFDFKASLDLTFMVQWMEIKFTDRALAEWYAAGEVMQTLLFNSLMVNGLTQDHNQNLPPNQTESKQASSRTKAFSYLSDVSGHQRAWKAFQIGDVMSSLEDLLIYQKKEQVESPFEALDHYIREKSSVNKDTKVSDHPDYDSPLENPSTVLSTKKKGLAKKKKALNRTRAMSVTSSTSLASLRSNSSRISRDKTSGSSVIPGTKKIRF